MILRRPGRVLILALPLALVRAASFLLLLNQEMLPSWLFCVAFACLYLLQAWITRRGQMLPR